MSDFQTRQATRLTAVIVGCWVAAAALAGVPDLSAERASARTRGSAPALKIVHSGPACLAGEGAPPAR